ncbi:SpaA isopeptide-forming pilin-related protein [Ligilactobacillus aviarius]|uniref:SpaA isopeptide-forming pilin-related protein n=1 Tax=Ligilactobacillus aviarius TaxID=1606 RepID=UPI0024B87F94|nr:SpaA isopeptide-forming pilin-related protein [Ligilactobacillus aviarius]
MSKSKFRIVRFLMVAISALALIILMTNSQKVQAADITSSEVNSISTNVGQAKPGQRVYFTMTFGNSLQVIHTGDTIHVTFPQATDTAAGIQGIPHQIPVKYNNPSDPGDPLNGQTIATADITTTGVTITFNSKMNGHILTSGSLSFTGQVVKKKGSNPTKVNNWPNMGNVPVPSIHVSQTITPVHTPNVGQGGTPNIVAPTGHVKKSGRIANNGNISWQVHGVLGDPGTTTITDTMKDGQTLVPGSIKITFFIQYQDGQWGTAHYAYDAKSYPVSEGKITESSNGFTITANQYNIAGALMGVDESGNQGDVKQVAYTITYQSKLSTTEQSDQWTNSVKQTNPDGSDGGSTTSDVKNSWQATANGTQPKNGVKLQKITTSNGQTVGLSGATFELSGNGKTETVVSNAAGIIEFNNLTAGTYTIKETKAPKGYSLNNEVINVTIDDQGKTTLTVNGKDISDNARVVDIPLAASSSSSSKSSSLSSNSKKSSLSSVKSSSSKVISSSKKSSLSSVKSSSSNNDNGTKPSSSSTNGGNNGQSSSEINTPIPTSSKVTVSSTLYFPVSSTITESSEKEFPSPEGSSASSIKVPVSVKKPTTVYKSSIVEDSSIIHGTSYSSSLIGGTPSESNSSDNKGGNTQGAVKNSSSAANTNGKGDQAASPNNGNQGANNAPASSSAAGTPTSSSSHKLSNGNQKKRGNGKKENLPQTGENSSIALVGLGVLTIVGLGFVLEKRK